MKGLGFSPFAREPHLLLSFGWCLVNLICVSPSFVQQVLADDYSKMAFLCADRSVCLLPNMGVTIVCGFQGLFFPFWMSNFFAMSGLFCCSTFEGYPLFAFLLFVIEVKSKIGYFFVKVICFQHFFLLQSVDLISPRFQHIPVIVFYLNGNYELKA